MKPSEKIWTILLGLSCLAYVALRAWNLTSSCLWFDEIFSIHAAEHSWNSLWWFVAQDLIHPPLFYALLKIWIGVGDVESLFWVRLFPVFFSTLALIPFLLLCRQLRLSLPAIFIALTFFAFNGTLIKYAQEVRMYSLLLCLALASMWLFAKLLDSGKGIVALIFINILMIYSHYFGWLVVASEIVATVILARGKIFKILTMLGVTALSYLPWAGAVWRATYKSDDFNQNLGWAERPDVWTILQFAFDFFEPVYFQQSSQEPVANFTITVPLMLLGLTSCVLWLCNWNERGDKEKYNFYLLSILALVPVAAAFVFSWMLPYSIWGTRHLLIVFAPLLILLAVFMENFKLLWLKAAGTGVVSLLFLAALIFQYNREKPKFIWCAWENLALDLHSINRESTEPVKIYAFEDMAAYNFWFPLRRAKLRQIINVDGVLDDREDKAYFLPRGFEQVKTVNFEEISGEQFWILFRAENWDESKAPLRNLSVKGYRFGNPIKFRAEGGEAFLVEAMRKNAP